MILYTSKLYFRSNLQVVFVIATWILEIYIVILDFASFLALVVKSIIITNLVFNLADVSKITVFIDCIVDVIVVFVDMICFFCIF